jgi:post-segregation antitoxin (ccd killing protein)
MTTVSISIELPEELVEKAKNAGILQTQRLIAMIENELRRETAWRYLYQSAQIVRANAQDEYEHLSEDEVMQIVNKEVRALGSSNSTTPTANGTV